MNGINEIKQVSQQIKGNIKQINEDARWYVLGKQLSKQITKSREEATKQNYDI